MHTTLKWLVTLVLCLLSLTAQAQQRNAGAFESGEAITPGKRVALVIGNGKYKAENDLPPLKNPVNDAEDIGAVLKGFGFDVTTLTNLDRIQMLEAIEQFRLKAGGSEAALFFFAGHGQQEKGKNYLMPVDGKARTTSEVIGTGIDVNVQVLAELEGSTKITIALLDACRMSASGKARGGLHGLAEIERPEGSVIAYATAPNKTAAEIGGNGRNGLWTQSLLKALKGNDLSLDTVLYAASLETKKLSGGYQTPHSNGDDILKKQFYFYGPAAVIVLPQRTTSLQQGDDPEQEFWNAIKDSNHVQDFLDYQSEYPKGKFMPTAKIKVRQLQKGEEQERLKREAEAAAAARQAEALRIAQAQEADRKAKEAAAEQARQEAKRKADAGLPPGKAFKDCADCPEMVVIPAGNFQMGSDKYDSEKPVHTVTIGKPFALGKTEVTQAQWKAVMGSAPPELSFKDCGGDCPVDSVSWKDAQEFIKKLNAKTGKTYRLPSEAEWEYACRAEGNHTYCGGNDLDAVGWYGDLFGPGGNSGKKTHPVAGKQANAFGLYDMSGNVWEWVEDCYHGSHNGAPVDGSAWTSGDCTVRVVRGGSWFSDPVIARAANRFRIVTSVRYDDLGFRLARMLP